MNTNQPFSNAARHLGIHLSIGLALLVTCPLSGVAQVTVHPEPGALSGGIHGHSITFRQASPAFGPIDTVEDAAALLGYTLPHGHVAFEALASGNTVINFTDTNTNPRPQQNFGGDLDIRRVPGSLFGTGDQDNYAARFSGFLYIPEAGSWSFTVNSDEGFRLRMGTANEVVLESPNPKLPGNVTSPVLIPSSGFYHYELVWFERSGGSEIEFFVNGPGQPADRLVGDASGTVQVFQTLRPIEHSNLGIQLISRSSVLLLWTNANLFLEEAASLTPANGWQLTPDIPTFQRDYFGVRVNATDATRFFRLRGALPPDPATVAPPVDPTVATSIGAGTDFLYTGTNPIQTGVAPGTIEAKRAAVVRGKVQQRDNTPLSGVHISILDHPELGRTLSRADGMFDLAVNGGGLLTVKYEKTGFCPVQRQVQVPWQEYVVLPDVVMIQMDPIVTPVELGLNSPMQVHQGSLQSDADGARRATILFTPGTCANLVLANGATQACSSLNIRATEFTVGPNGPAAMPAALPPSSGYTYCVALTADEAIAEGATTVQFDRPLPVYVENFLGFPVGISVPVGYYDRQKGQWIASDNGRVIKVLTVAGGLAELDTDGDAAADDTVKLAELGVTDEERARLAQLYPPGQTLWRVSITHFTDWDENWGSVPDCDPQVQSCDPKQPSPQAAPPLDNPNKECGSVISCEDQTLGESVAVSGTAWQLHYQSGRTPGGKSTYTLDIPLSSATVPPTLRRIDLVVSVAGQQFTQSFPAASNQRATFTWDGRDAYGRLLQGPQAATVRIGYAYALRYIDRGSRNRFGYNGNGVMISGDFSQRQATLWQDHNLRVGLWDNRSLGLGGWSLNIQHAYDPVSRRLLLGDGSQRRADAMPTVITTVAGGDRGGDGGPATQARLNQPFGVAVAPDGSLYIADRDAHKIRRVGTDGIITTVAGNGTGDFGGDGGPATQARLDWPLAVAVAPDGSFYIADENRNYRIRRVGTDGIITTVAGNGISGFSGDGGPATQASITNPYDVAVGPDGSLYIADFVNNRIRQVTPDGIITTVAGNGSGGFSGDGGPATQAGLNPSGVSVAADGSMYIVDRGHSRVRRVSPAGIITTVAGGATGGLGDGGPATQARLSQPFRVAVVPDGSFYIGDQGNNRIRRVGPDGIITTVAGNGTFGVSGDGGPATKANLAGWLGVAVAPDGTFYICDQYNNRIRRVAPALPAFAASAILLSSEDGRELYTFNSNGRHLKTLDALTGAVRYQFAYGSSGYLTSVTDGSSNVTTIERVGAMPTAIVAPDGQRTALTVSADGWLLGAANPASEAHIMSYSADGLLRRFTDPLGNNHVFTYDALGRLIKDENPAGGSTTLARTEQTNGYTVTTATALGRSRVYRVERLSTGVIRRSVTQPDGVKTVTVINTDASEQTTNSDGSVITIQYGPDPRWGMLARVATSATVRNAGGLTQTITTTHSATLSDSNNLLSLTKLTDTATINGRTFTNTYDAATRTMTSTSAAGRQGKAVIDSLGRIVQSQVTGVLPNILAYDMRGRLASITQGTGVVARTATLSYDTNGYLDAVTDPLGRKVSLAYDAAGRVTSQTLPDGRVILYGYDLNGNLNSLAPPGRPAHLFSYTPVDLRKDYTPPDVGAGNNSTRYAYDPDKQLTRTTRPDGQILDLGYDNGGGCNCGRLSTLTLPTGVSSFAYDATTGKLTGITTPGGDTLSYTYTGALLTRTTWAGTVAGNISGTYDNDFRVTSLSVNGTNAIAFQYDADGLLTNAGNLRLVRNPQNGLLTATTLGNVSDSIGYDGFGEVTNYSAGYSGSDGFKTIFSYDKLGRITTKIETVEGTTALFEYHYDLSDRLAEVQKNGTVTATYTYDSNGNRLTAPSLSTAPTYDDQDRLTQYAGTTYSYTANGELKTKTSGALVTTYNYDVLGNLRQVVLPDGKSIDYSVDGRNRRIGKNLNGVLTYGFIYQDGLKPIAEFDAANHVVSRFVYVSRVNVPDYMIKGGVTYRIITDHLGSPRLVVNIATATVAQRLDYDEFGQVLTDTNPGFQPFGFAGGLYDHDTKMLRFGARDYDSEIGRWTAKDPIDFGAGEVNLYGYAGNDPINFIDPSGLDRFDDLLDPAKSKKILKKLNPGRTKSCSALNCPATAAAALAYLSGKGTSAAACHKDDMEGYPVPGTFEKVDQWYDITRPLREHGDYAIVEGVRGGNDLPHFFSVVNIRGGIYIFDAYQQGEIKPLLTRDALREYAKEYDSFKVRVGD